MPVRRWMLIVPLLWSACGGNDVKDPQPIPGGGVGAGDLDGELNVFVLDGATDAPIAGATVRVERPTPLIGATDGTGLVTFADIAGKQTVTVTAAGWAAATWIGVSGAVVTITLEPDDAAPVATAHATGSIAGWGSLPAPADGHRYETRVMYSRIDPITAAENSVGQIPCIGAACDRCVRTASEGSSCNFAVNTRVGHLVLYALIVDRALNGLGNEDDTFTPIGLAMSTPIDLAADQTLTNVTLSLLGDVTLNDVTVVLQPPVAFDFAAAAPGIDLGDDGILVFDEPGYRTNRLTLKVPATTGSLAAGEYLFYSVALDDLLLRPIPQANTILRHVTVTGTVDVSRWLAFPDLLNASEGTYSFTAATGADLYVVRFTQGSGARWIVAILDGSTQFTLPALTPAPLALGETQMHVIALDAERFDPQDFTANELLSGTLRVSQNRLTFER